MYNDYYEEKLNSHLCNTESRNLVLWVVKPAVLFITITKKSFIVEENIRRTDHATPLYPQKLALTSPTSGGRSVGIVRSRTKATELVD
jgi:hypothetical protein